MRIIPTILRRSKYQVSETDRSTKRSGSGEARLDEINDGETCLVSRCLVSHVARLLTNIMIMRMYWQPTCRHHVAWHSRPVQSPSEKDPRRILKTFSDYEVSGVLVFLQAVSGRQSTVLGKRSSDIITGEESTLTAEGGSEPDAASTFKPRKKKAKGPNPLSMKKSKKDKAKNQLNNQAGPSKAKKTKVNVQVNQSSWVKRYKLSSR